MEIICIRFSHAMLHTKSLRVCPFPPLLLRLCIFCSSKHAHQMASTNHFGKVFKIENCVNKTACRYKLWATIFGWEISLKLNLFRIMYALYMFYSFIWAVINSICTSTRLAIVCNVMCIVYDGRRVLYVFVSVT